LNGWALGASSIHFNGNAWKQLDPRKEVHTLRFYSIALIAPEEWWAVGEGLIINHYYNGVLSPA